MVASKLNNINHLVINLFVIGLLLVEIVKQYLRVVALLALLVHVIRSVLYQNPPLIV